MTKGYLEADTRASTSGILASSLAADTLILSAPAFLHSLRIASRDNLARKT